MAGSQGGKRPWIPFLLGLAIAVLAIWFVAGRRGDAPWGGGDSEMAAARSFRQADGMPMKESDAPTLHIAAGGRLVIEERDLPTHGALAVALELSDEARGDGPRSARIISTVSGRLDVQATPLPGSGSGIRLDVDRAFLARGLYLIEIDTVDHHPLQFRRYVLEIQ